MYVILASKPGHFRTESSPGMEEIEAYDYVFYGRTRGRYVIARMGDASRVTIIDESDAGSVNHVPAKFLPRFDSLEAARAELRQLARFGSMDIALVRVALPTAHPESR